MHCSAASVSAAPCSALFTLFSSPPVPLQLEEAEGRGDAAQAVYASGLKRCPDCVPMWRAAARLEEAQGNTGRARALLEQVGGFGGIGGP